MPARQRRQILIHPAERWPLQDVLYPKLPSPPHLLALSSRVSVWSWSGPPGRRTCWWGAAGEGGAWNHSGHTWWPGRRTGRRRERRQRCWEAHFPSNTRQTQTQPHLHLVVAQSLQHFQADLLTVCWNATAARLEMSGHSCLDMFIFFFKRAWLSCAVLSWRTQPGVQKQSSNTLRIAVLLILEDLAGYYLLLHLQ